MLKNKICHLSLEILLVSAAYCGPQLIQPATISAAPYIQIDYNSSNGTYWAVDKGSVTGIGTPQSPYSINAEWIDRWENCIGTRFFDFKQENGVWKYRYHGYTGKGGKIPYTNWSRVSSNKLANDILYIVLN